MITSQISIDVKRFCHSRVCHLVVTRYNMHHEKLLLDLSIPICNYSELVRSPVIPCNVLGDLSLIIIASRSRKAQPAKVHGRLRNSPFLYYIPSYVYSSRFSPIRNSCSVGTTLKFRCDYSVTTLTVGILDCQLSVTLILRLLFKLLSDSQHLNYGD